MRKQLPFVIQVKSALYDGTIISAVNYCESENEVDFRIDSTSLVTKETNANALNILRTVLMCCLFTAVMCDSLCFFRSRLGD